ncbi:MAG: MYG1 family protein [Erysipelotrichia bacterium]|nr:MYG1 family protein [Erysipelotrichia bacterium]
MPTIFTHGGTAHRDEVLACAIILAKEHASNQDWSIRRVSAIDETAVTDLDYVVDIGGVYDPLSRRFDHHQDDKLPASVVLVMRHFGILDAAYEWYPWVEFTDIMDTQGPRAAAEWLDVRASTLAHLRSPLELAFLREFENSVLVVPGSFIHDALLLVGRDIIDGLEIRAERLELLKTRTVVEWCEGQPLCIYFLDDVPRPEMALRMFRRRFAPGARIGVITNVRGSGWSMFRFEDRSGVDFRHVATHPEVEFVHTTGFLATTKTRCPTDILRQLVRHAAGISQENSNDT